MDNNSQPIVMENPYAQPLRSSIQVPPAHQRNWLGTGKAHPKGEKVYFAMMRGGVVGVYAETTTTDERGVRSIIHRVYRDAHGYLVPIPLNDADPTKGAAPSTINRTENTPDGPRDLYLAKAGWRFAVPEDVFEWEAMWSAGRGQYLERKRALDPLTAQERIAELQATVLGKAILAATGKTMDQLYAEARSLEKSATRAPRKAPPPEGGGGAPPEGGGP